jgi:hypothetical protein
VKTVPRNVQIVKQGRAMDVSGLPQDVSLTRSRRSRPPRRGALRCSRSAIAEMPEVAAAGSAGRCVARSTAR